MSGNDPLDPENIQQQLVEMLKSMGMSADDLADPQQLLEKLQGMMASAMPGAGASMGDPWVSAGQIAESIAAQGGADANVDPKTRIQIEDLARVAHMYAEQQPGVQLSESANIKAVSRRTWTSDSMSSYRPFFDRFIEALKQNGVTEMILPEELLEAEGEDAGAELTGMAAMLSGSMEELLPRMVAQAAGVMMGSLGQRVIGSYDLPVPREGGEVQVVPDSLAEIADATGAPISEVHMYVMIHELLAHSVLSVPHVAARLDALYMDFASAFRPNHELIMEEFGDIDPSDPSKLGELSTRMQDPSWLLRMMRSRTHDLLMPQLDALVAAVLGFVEHSTMTACSALMTGHPAIRDAIRARRMEQGSGENFTEKLLGLNIDQSTFDRGTGFIAGIVERSGVEGLERLWADELDLPTAAEVDAPGLWLERIGLGDGDLPTFEIPDDLSGL